MKKDFIEYIKKEFGFTDDEIQKFEQALNMPLKKSLRINTNKISIDDFKNKQEKKGWILTKTNLGKNIFYVDRPENELKIALGNTPLHIAGYFYVQEVAASSSPFYMSNDIIDENEYLILDMSASPGGKTTQLLEYYPNSLIVANELDKNRLKGFFSNLDRLSATNAVATNYDARYFKQLEEIFDKVLLDAPCSGEGTAFKTNDALKYWNIKNIKTVSKLQFGLLESAIKTCKVGGEIVYSTCTLNKFENEQVIEKALEKYGDYIEINPVVSNEVPFKRNWPHYDFTGGFFVAKLKKIKSLNTNNKEIIVRQNYEKITKNEQNLVLDFFKNNFSYDISKAYLYKYKNEIFLLEKNINDLWDKIFLYKIGISLGEIKDSVFYPSFFAGTFKRFESNNYILDDITLDRLLKGYEVDTDLKDGYYQMIHEDIEIGIARHKDSKLKSLIPSNMMRK